MSQATGEDSRCHVREIWLSRKINGRCQVRILVLGGDGYLGWPTALHLSRAGYEVGVADNFARRGYDLEMGVDSLVPIASLHRRVELLGGRLGPAPRRLHRRPHRGGVRPRHGGQLPARRHRPLRRAAQRPLLHGRPQARRLHPGEQRGGHAQPALRHRRRRPVDPPGEAGHHGGVRHPQHRHRRGLHRDHPPGTHRRPARSPSSRAASTTCPRSTTATTSPSAAGRGASARPTSTRGWSTASRPRRRRCTPTWRPGSTTTPCSAPC